MISISSNKKHDTQLYSRLVKHAVLFILDNRLNVRFRSTKPERNVGITAKVNSLYVSFGVEEASQGDVQFCLECMTPVYSLRH